MESGRGGLAEMTGTARVLLGILSKRKWFAMGVFVIAVAATYLYDTSCVAIYGATATVILEKRQPTVLGRSVEFQENSNAEFWQFREYIKTQVEIVRSRRIAKRVVDRLGLSMDAHFLGLDRLDPPLEGEQLLERIRHMDAVGILMGKVTVEVKTETQVMMVTVQDSDPKMAQQLANTLVEEYRDDSIEFKKRQVSDAMAELRAILVQLRREKEDAENQVLDFERRFSFGTIAARRAALKQRLELLNGQAVTTRLQRIELESSPERTVLEARIAEVRGLLESKDLSLVAEKVLVSSSSITELKASIVVLDAKIRELEATYGPKWPALQAAYDQRRMARAALQREARLLLETELQSLTSQLDAATDKLLAVVRMDDELGVEIERAKTEESALAKLEMDHEPLVAKRDEARKRFDQVSERYAQAALAAQVDANNIRIQDQAIEPVSPVKPNRKLNYMVGILAGLFLGLVAAFLVEAIDSTIKTREDIEGISGLWFAGHIPATDTSDLDSESGLTSELFTYLRPKSTEAEHVRTVRTNLFFSQFGGQPKLVLVTSPGPREGKTLVCNNLAAASAMAGNKTLVIDADLRRPRVHRVYGMSRRPGVMDYYLSEKPFTNFIRPTQVEGLHVMASGALVTNPVEILESERYMTLLNELQSMYDVVFIDSPPVGVVSDAKIIGTRMDPAVVIVVQAGSTTKEALREAASMLTTGQRRIGVILNKFDVAKHSYRYYHYRSKKYGYYNYYTYDAEAGNESAGLLDVPKEENRRT